MSTNQALFPVTAMARVLGVSTAGYYAWRDRPPSPHAQADTALLTRVRTIHATSRHLYGAPRVHAQLRADGQRHGRKRIARLMRAAGLVGACHRGSGPTTTRRDQDDACSRKIVGWSMANHLRTELVLDALEMAVGQRRPHDVIHHSDQGSQYTSLAFGGRCREVGIRPSMGSVGDAYDNAMCESFFSTLECDLLSRRKFVSQAEAKVACFSYIEGFYNPVRLHSAVGYQSPIHYEQQTAQEPAVTT
jgi:putative transposase